MTTITLDPQPDSPECFRIDATTAPRNAPPSDDRPRLVCEWKRTADGRMTSTWTLRDESAARMRRPTRVRVRRRDCNCRSGRLTGVDLAASAAVSDHPLDGHRRCFSRPCDGRLIPFHHGKFAPNKSGVRPWKPGLLHERAQQCDGTVAQRNGLAATELMCPSPHQGGTDRGCTLLPSPDLTPFRNA